jgi:hypothetical protein
MYQHEKKNGCRERERGAGPPVWSDSTLGVEIFGHFGWILMRRFFNTCWAGQGIRFFPNMLSLRLGIGLI